MLDFDLSLDDHDELNEMAHSELAGNFMWLRNQFNHFHINEEKLQKSYTNIKSFMVFPTKRIGKESNKTMICKEVNVMQLMAFEECTLQKGYVH